MDEEQRAWDEENNSVEPGSIELELNQVSITPVEPVSARNMLESCFLTVARSSYRNLVVIMLWVAGGPQYATENAVR